MKKEVNVRALKIVSICVLIVSTAVAIITSVTK